MKRDANGQIFVDQNGTVATEAITDPDKYIKLGSVLPKGNLAWRNNFIWKNFTAGFLISAVWVVWFTHVHKLCWTITVCPRLLPMHVI